MCRMCGMCVMCINVQNVLNVLKVQNVRSVRRRVSLVAARTIVTALTARIGLKAALPQP